MHQAPIILLIAVAALAAEEPTPVPLTAMKITDAVSHHLSPYVFGQFMERASWGEPGYEAARVPGSRELDPRVVDQLAQWDIPVIRFPAGTDLTHIDWRDMIDHVPGRTGPRPLFQVKDRAPLSNEFGLEEFFALCRRLGAQPLLPLPLENAVRRLITPEELAMRHAGLVAYCNAPLGATLPPGMPDWPAVRAANGHPEPHRVRWFQLGNEVWMYWEKAMEQAGIPPEDVAGRYAHYRRCLDACVTAMRAIDPSIELIMEGSPAWKAPEIEQWLLADAALRAQVPWCVYHEYRPWEIGVVERDGAAIDPATVTAEEIWRAWVAAAPAFDARGQAITRSGEAAGRQGWRIAITEWNWNGWWKKGMTTALDSDLAKGLGAAGMLHAYMRRSDIGMACQSMLVGSSWGITGIRVDPTGEVAPYPLPTAQVVGLYARHHGDRVVVLERDAIDGYAQPLRMSGIQPVTSVAWVDAICTADDEAWYVHLINRRFDQAETLRIDATSCGTLAGADLHRLDGTIDNRPIAPGSQACARIVSSAVPIDGAVIHCELPARSVAVLVLRKR